MYYEQFNRQGDWPVSTHMLELVQVTVQYSNAVLVAILPFVSHFAEKLQLPPPTPLNVAMVQTFTPDPRRGEIGGQLTLTNGYTFWFQRGHVNYMASPNAYYQLQDPNEIPRFFGPVRLTEADALQTTRKTITNLGYSLESVFAHLPPKVTPPPMVGTNTIPRYRLEWADPVYLGTSISLEVNATNGRIESFTSHSPKLERQSPKISVQTSSVSSNRLSKALTVGQSNALLRFILPQVSEWSRKLNLPVELPVTSNSIAQVIIRNADWDARVELTNGFAFDCERGYVRGFKMRDTFWRREPRTMLDEKLLWGEWKLSQDDAVALVRQAATKIGGEAEAALLKEQPTVLKPPKVAQYVVPRYWIEWIKTDPQHVGTELEIAAEVDADKRLIKYLRVFNGRLWRNVPNQ
jgi:hypothetical protein